MTIKGFHSLLQVRNTVHLRELLSRELPLLLLVLLRLRWIEAWEFPNLDDIQYLMLANTKLPRAFDRELESSMFCSGAPQ